MTWESKKSMGIVISILEYLDLEFWIWTIFLSDLRHAVEHQGENQGGESS